MAVPEPRLLHICRQDQLQQLRRVRGDLDQKLKELDQMEVRQFRHCLTHPYGAWVCCGVLWWEVVEVGWDWDW